MTKTRRVHVCQECGHQSRRWYGRCPACGQWNTMVEETEAGGTDAAGGRGYGGRHQGWLTGDAPTPVSVATAVEGEDSLRWVSGYGEVDRVLGGGFVPGSLVLLGGDPGIGKSTLLLQVAARLAAAGRPVLYVSGEESAAQIGRRAQRIAAGSAHSLDGLLLLTAGDIAVIEGHIANQAAGGAAIIDSIQTVFDPEITSAPGSVAQVRECAARLLRLAKATGTVIILVGHVTKEGGIAGPRTLEHATDVVLYMEGDPHHPYRLLRSVKNRYGTTRELGVFEMGSAGLQEVPDPSGAFLRGRPARASGSVVVAGLEGSRPILVEVQALVAPSPFPHPRRTVAGLPTSRVDLLLAVLERRAGLAIGGRDVYVKVSGGLRLDEPAADLGILLALASAFTERPVHPDTAVLGEVGLAGEVRAVPRMDDRIREAARLGFARCIVPGGAGERKAAGTGPAVPVSTVREAMDAALMGR